LILFEIIYRWLLRLVALLKTKTPQMRKLKAFINRLNYKPLSPAPNPLHLPLSRCLKKMKIRLISDRQSSKVPSSPSPV